MAKPDATTSPDGLTPFPDRLGAVFVKELRQGLRARQFVWPFVAVQLIAIFSVAIEYILRDAADGVGGGGFVGGLLGETGGMFYFLLNIVFAVILPLTLFGALQPELMGGRNIELLLMSNLTRWEIVRGKWLVGSTLSGLMIVSLVPYALTRYFIGGVGLLQSILVIFLLAITNAAMNGIIIGASGFKNYFIRIILIGVSLVSSAITTTLCLIPVGIASSMSARSGGNPIFEITMGVVLGSLSAALFIAYGLQLGRAQLRLYENPIDPPSSGLIIALIIFTPIIVGVTALSTAGIGGFGGIIGVIGLFILALFIDRGPGRNSQIRYAQP